MQNKTVWVALPLLVAFAVTPVGAATIDDFSVALGGCPVSKTTVGSQSIQEIAGAPILGGVREVAIEATSLDVPVADSVNVGVFPGASIFDYASSVGANGTTGLRYDGGSGLGVDLSGDALLRIDFMSFDLANGLAMPVTVTLEDSGAQAAVLTKSLIVAGGQSLVFPFADFSNIGGVNLADIDTIDIDFDPGMASDFRLSGIATDVPEPMTLSLLVLGMVFSRVRRRVAQL